MPHGPFFDDDAIDAIVSGTARGDDAVPLASFVEDVRSASRAVPTPSAALAAALANGISPNTADGHQPMWRKWKMKIKGFVAGLGIAGKLALGAGVAAAATTGAGAAGVLPSPVQHAFAKAVNAVTPFEAPGDGEHHDVAEPPHETTSTTIRHDSTTTVPKNEGDGEHDDDNGVVVTPTTEHHEGDGKGDGDGSSTPTTEHHGDDHDGDTTPTTEHHGDDGNGGTTPTTEHHENTNPESLTISCTRGREPNHVTCSWSWKEGANPAHHKFVLLRTSEGHEGQVVDQTEDGTSYSDTTVTLGAGYTYRVISLNGDGTTIAHSNGYSINCCGD